MINQTSRRLNKAKQIKSTRLRKSFFPKKNWLPQVGFEPTTLCSLDRVLSHRGSSVDMGRISYTNTKQGKANHLNLINRYILHVHVHVGSSQFQYVYTCMYIAIPPSSMYGAFSAHCCNHNTCQFLVRHHMTNGQTTPTIPCRASENKILGRLAN